MNKAALIAAWLLACAAGVSGPRVRAAQAVGQASSSAAPRRGDAAFVQRKENAEKQRKGKGADGGVTAATAQRGVELATSGHCNEALPLLKKTMRAVAGKDLRYNVAISAARCAVSLDQRETAADALFFLQKEFPQDPQTLYLATHYFSELASRASQELEKAAPDSAQAQQLQAEALESQAKWEEAAAEYRGILQREPQARGVHYRLGRVYLSMPASPENTAKAKEEFGEELKIDPANASAEFLLGEIARRGGDWNAAIAHFTAASRKDAGFAEAFLALGMSLNAAERFADAVEPLEKYTKIVAEDPAGHYQLAVAYSRTGRRTEATREMALQQELVRKNPNGVRPPE